MAGPKTNRTAVAHPRVAEYLRQLDTMLRRVPSRRATELREQITTHIEDALGPGASDEEVAEVLASLGRPADLAAEAVATAGRRPWPARVGWQTWTFIVVVILAIAAGVSYRAVMLSAPPIEPGIFSSWLYQQDGTRAVTVRAGGAVQSTVPIRPGQQQGILVEVFNPSSQAQTVLGSTSNQSPACSTWHLTVSTKDPNRVGYHPTPPFRYTGPGVIPPHQGRMLRVLWTSARDCLSNGSFGGFDQLTLRVRVGLLTRTEVVPLSQDWTLAGAK